MQRIGLCVLLGSLLLSAACGGGASAGAGSVASNNSTSITSVVVSCKPSVVASGHTSQCSAAVGGTGSFVSSVTWSTKAGTISASGLLTTPVATTSLVDSVTATSIQDSTKTGTASVTVNPVALSGNVAPLIVDEGPDPTQFVSANMAFTTVTVCAPGSTTECQTIDHVQVDTGSSGLRILSSVLNVTLPAENDSNGNPLAECVVFADGFVWGPILSADITISGEKASGVPVQIMIPSSGSPSVPSSCSSQSPSGENGNEGGSVQAFGANAIVGVGLFQQDCGAYCVVDSSDCGSTINSPCIYYECPSSGCNPSLATLAQQVPNPVILFPLDNNGVLIQLPSVGDGGSSTVSGNLIFGIGTESNNALNGVTVYPVPDDGNNAGDFITVIAGQSYPQSFIDSGSNGYFFSGSNVLTCSDQPNWYCPATSPDGLSATNQGQSDVAPVGSAVTVNFNIENADNLFGTNNSAFSTLAGPIPAGLNAFDWGLPFFYGRNVFTAIETSSTPGGIGPYFAY